MKQKRLLFLIPLTIFLVFGFIFTKLMLDPGRDASKRPSVLIGKPAPEVNLPPLYGYEPGLTSEMLKSGKPVLINFFASWCVPCRAEHDSLMHLAQKEGATIIGIAYMNKEEDARAFLEELGNPYRQTAQDLKGRTGIDFGVTAVPETFIIDGDGTIRYRHQGPIVGDALEKRVLPALKEISR